MVVLFTVLGVVCMLYGVSVMLIRSGTLFFAVWFVLGALFLGCAWATRAHLWDALPVALRNIGAGAIALLLTGFLVTQGLVASQFFSKGEAGLDYLVVLGAQVHPNGTPSAVLQYRLDAAIEYLEQNPTTTCIVSGGQGHNETMTEAAGMAAYLQSHGVPAERIVLEDQSEDTAQNIANSLGFINPARDRVGIVTNNFHVFRAVAIARKAGIEHVCGIAAYSMPFYLPNNMLRESMGIAKDFTSGNL